jgi:hypothetical protein
MPTMTEETRYAQDGDRVWHKVATVRAERGRAAAQTTCGLSLAGPGIAKPPDAQTRCEACQPVP